MKALGTTTDTRERRAVRFAAAHFPGCEVHSGEARLLFDALERVARRPLPLLDPDVTIEALAQDSEWLDRALIPDSLDVVEVVMALEEEFGQELVPPDSQVSSELVALALSRLLLGPAADRTGWISETVWCRSVRGVINERVRWRGGCTCSQNSG